MHTEIIRDLTLDNGIIHDMNHILLEDLSGLRL